MSSPAAPEGGRRGTAQAGPDPTEVARLRAERDEALAALNRYEDRQHRGGAVRRTLAGVFVVLFAVLVPIAATAAWAHRTVLDTSTYVDTVAPIASDPAVTAVVSREVTDELYTALDPQAIIAGALPPKAAFLAGPIANGARSQVQSAVDKVISSPQFQQLWTNANRFAHQQLVTVLRGDSAVLQTTDGQVVLNLVPLLNQALASAQDFVSGVVGKPVTLPTITGNEVPSAACQKISTALDRPLPSTCGQIPLFPADKLTEAQRAVRGFDRLVLAMLIVTPLLAAAALLISRRRRRTLLQLTVGAALMLVVVRRLVMWEQNKLIANAPPQNADARSAIVHQVLNGFFDLTVWLLVAALVVAVVALVTGPYRWAVDTRRGVASWGRAGGHLVAASFAGGPAGDGADPQVAWVRRHFDLLRVGGVVVALLLVLLLSVNVWGFLVIALLLAVYEVGLHRLRPPESVTLPPSAPPPAPPPQRAG